MKRTTAKFLCVILAVALLLTALPITVYAENNIIPVSTAQELTDACSRINTNGGEYTISLTADIDGNIEITNSSAVVTVAGNGHTITASITAVDVSNGATVNLGDGNTELFLTSSETNDDPGVIVVKKDSTCNMYDKVVVKDHKSQNYLGAGAIVDGGTFHMYGGTIDNCGIDGGTVCFGGGVSVVSGGEFIMEDGSVISNCYAISDYSFELTTNHLYTAMGGGVFVTSGSIFTMNGGIITGCEATNFGGGVAMVISDSNYEDDEFGLYGVGNPQSTVTINGGTITGNKAKSGAGIFASGFYTAFTTDFSKIPPESGTQHSPGLFINGGEISSNEATDIGGGVHVSMIRGTAQIHNAEIKNNTAKTGAGIENRWYYTQLDIDGCIITGNNAASNGGGIAAFLNSGYGQVGYTNIKDTTITGNTSGDRGAGVYYDAESEIRLSGANVIKDNTYNGKANNLNVLSLEKPVTIAGDLTGSQIGLSDPTLWDDGKEDYAADAVSTERLTDGFKANNASLIPKNAFTSDHESWVVDFGEKKTEQIETGRTYTYTARTYPAVSRTTGSQSARGTLIDVVAKTTFSTGGRASSLSELYNELTTRYKEEYQETDQNHYYDPVSGSSIEVFPYGYNVFVYVDNYVLFAGASYQQYVPEGHFALVFYSGTLDNAEFSDEYTEETTVVLGEPIDNDEAEYGFDDLGHTVSKTELNKSSEVLDIQYDTVITDYTGEVRLVRADINYHINNDVIKEKYDNDDIFTDEVEAKIGEIKVGDTIDSFYLIPEATPTSSNSCPYIFKGWYYDPENDNDTRPVNFGTDKYSKDIYAHWITVNDVEKDEADEKDLPPGYTKYGGFDLCGVQIRKEMRDYNFDDVAAKMPGGMRFICSLSMDVVNQINGITPNNIEYGFVATTNKDWINYHDTNNRKLQYVSTNTNDVNTYDPEGNETYFGFAANVNCTSRRTNRNGIVAADHKNFGEYLLYSLVITYEGDDPDYGKNVLARPYIKYTDANGLERVAYSEYRGTSNTLGGCYTNYNAIPKN